MQVDTNMKISIIPVVFIKQTGGNASLAGDYFLQRMNPHLVLW